MFKETIKYISKTLLLLGGVSFMTGCVADDRAECNFPLRLEIKQIPLNAARGSEASRFSLQSRAAGLSNEVKGMKLFLFDNETGTYVAEMEPELPGDYYPALFNWPVPPGTYRVVVWGGGSERYAASSTEALEGAVLETLRSEDGVSIEQQESHLFYGIQDSLVITGDYQNVYTVELYKKSKNLKVEVVGLTPDMYDRLECKIEAPSVLGFDGKVSQEHEMATFLPEDIQKERSLVKFFTLPSLEAGDGSKLYIKLAATEGEEEVTIYTGSLTDLIQSSPNVNISEDEEIEINVNFYGETTDIKSHVDILVNDYVVIHQDVELK